MTEIGGVVCPNCRRTASKLYRVSTNTGRSRQICWDCQQPFDIAMQGGRVIGVQPVDQPQAEPIRVFVPPRRSVARTRL